MYQKGQIVKYPTETSEGWATLDAEVAFYDLQSDVVEIRYRHPDQLGQVICESSTSVQLQQKIRDRVLSRLRARTGQLKSNTI